MKTHRSRHTNTPQMTQTCYVPCYVTYHVACYVAQFMVVIFLVLVRPFGAFPFLLKNDHFTKTGSGQTRGQKLTEKRRFLASGVRCVREPLRVQVDEGQKGGAHRANQPILKHTLISYARIHLIHSFLSVGAVQ